MNKLLAVSGGIDSMVMLDMLCAEQTDGEIFVAHFNHGTRPSANDDEIFVKDIVENKYRKKFFAHKVNLGENASEASARNARYDFLKKLARELDAEIYTAHHLDDLVESVTINCLRGTGWRGLAVLSGENIRRPFLERAFLKNDILKYAAEHNIIFRQDPTNSDDIYLRNRIREPLKQLKQQNKLYSLWSKQLELKTEIDKLLDALIPEDGVYQRQWFSDCDVAALEFIRHALKINNVPVTRPQAEDFLDAIKNYVPGKNFNLPNDVLVTLHRTFFRLR